MSDFSSFSDKMSNLSSRGFLIVGCYLKIIRLELEIKKHNYEISQIYKKIGDKIYTSYINAPENLKFNDTDFIEKINSITNIKEIITEKEYKIKELKASIRDIKNETEDNDFEGEL